MILALDSSADPGSAALVDADGPVVELDFPGGRQKGGGAARALKELAGHPGSIRAVVVGTGPGSYNGIRSALAAAWGFAFSRKVPFCGVSSLLGIAGGSHIAVGDARQGQFYFAKIDNRSFSVEPRLGSLEAVGEWIREHPGVPVFTPTDLTQHFPGCRVQTPRAALLAQLSHHAKFPPVMPEPLYLKPPHITAPKAHGR